MAISIQIGKDTVTPALQRITAALRGDVRRVMGRAVGRLISDHLYRLNSERPNALGGRRTNFWSAAAKSVSFQETPDGAVVSISQIGIRQRFQGGFIRPVNRKYLTIPAAPEAHGRRASEFSNLRFGFGVNKYGNLQPALVEASASRVKFIRGLGGALKTKNLGGTGGKVMFWLARRAFQRADPTVLPTLSEMEQTAAAAAAGHLERALGGPGGES